jgi:hypothetical protein
MPGVSDLVSDMFPDATLNNRPDRTAGNTKHRGNIGVAYPVRCQLADVNDVRLLQFGVLMRLTSEDAFRMQSQSGTLTRCGAAFRKHVSGVVSGGTKEQVGRADTRWVVTVMQYPEADWNLAIVQQPTCPVCGDGPPWRNEVSARIDRSVALEREFARPDPARTEIRPMHRDRPVFVHALPKPNIQRSVPSGAKASDGAIA